MTSPSVHLRAQRQAMRYHRILPLGRGGMAIVHLCLAIGQSGFKRLVVVKEIREEFVANPEMRQMFLTEARLSARLNHPNVVQVSEVIDAPDGVMLVMEYLDGLSLAGAYRKIGDALTLPMRLRIVSEVLAALHYAHDLADYHGTPLGIVHRDVSPQNVFVTYDGRVKLLDFGIAKATAMPDHTRAGTIKGRIAYMPIEQLRGERVDRRADIYATGCLLWEAIAGTRMWDKLSEVQIVRRVFAGKIPALSSRVAVDPELERIVNRAIAQEPSQRYATAEEMRLDLERFLRSQAPATLREVGAILNTACAEARELRQEAIAQAIDRFEREFPALEEAEAAQDPISVSIGFGTGAHSSSIQIPIAAAETALSGGADGSGSTPASLSRAASALRSRSSGVGWFAAGAVVIAAAFGVHQYQSAALETAEPVTAALPDAVPVDAMLTVDVTPQGARVLINGVEVTGNPPSSRVPVNSEHSIRVEMPGYMPAERRVLVDVDSAVRFHLEPLPAPAPASSTKAEPEATSRRPFVAAPPPVAPVRPEPSGRSRQANCDPPYYFSNGIKTYKPECI